ncbi:hypothetical protein [Glycomyces sp. YM15]|uniref:hypothetical protein n=1 Tax=Glycomyces sp. YM15 TaxID=2800446 RepID=UPI001964588B|nr:hypothetical protein [Glycomyces sp. YM15]
MTHRSTDPPPQLGNIVHYREPGGRELVRAAIVTATADTADPAGAPRGAVPALSGREHVHLRVLTPEGDDYVVLDVAHRDFHLGPTPGCWGWPERTRRRHR